MAGLASEPGSNSISNSVHSAISSRRFFRTIAWLRWRIFINSLRGKGAVGEAVVKFLSYPLLAIMVLGPSIGAGFAAWYFASHGMDAYLAIPLWVIFLLWQLIGVSTSATGPTFDLDSLTRFPIRYRDYLLMRLSFGIMDPPTLSGLGCLFAMSIGIAIATPELLPWAALALFMYAACNVFFSRMVYTWMERWLAQRRTRELLTGLILVLSLGFQFASQFIQRLTSGHHHAPMSAWMTNATQILLTVNWLLPPGLTSYSIEHMHGGDPGLAIASLAALLAYTVVFLLILHVRLYAQYRGENLSEAPAAQKRTQRKARTAVVGTRTESGTGFRLLSPTVAALLAKETRLLLRSGPKLYALVMPVFVLFLISFRSAGLEQAGVGHGTLSSYLFSYGCAYTELIFVGFMYNALANDGAGVQFYFIAPLRMRQVVFAKNLLLAIILTIEVILMYIVSRLLSAHEQPAMLCATLTWTIFTFLINIAIGNVRSLVSPKGVDPTKVRRQNVSGLNSLISLAVVFVCCALGQLALFLCRLFLVSFWYAAAAFLVLAIIAAVIYALTLDRIDDIAAAHVEDLSRELARF